MYSTDGSFKWAVTVPGRNCNFYLSGRSLVIEDDEYYFFDGTTGDYQMNRDTDGFTKSDGSSSAVTFDSFNVYYNGTPIVEKPWYYCFFDTPIVVFTTFAVAIFCFILACVISKKSSAVKGYKPAVCTKTVKALTISLFANILYIIANIVVTIFAPKPYLLIGNKYLVNSVFAAVILSNF